jgi:hypothetical protein
MKIIQDASGSALKPEKWDPRVRSINADIVSAKVMVLLFNIFGAL